MNSANVWRIMWELVQVRHSSTSRFLSLLLSWLLTSLNTHPGGGMKRTSVISVSLSAPSWRRPSGCWLFPIFTGHLHWGSRWLHSSLVWELFYTKEQQQPNLWPQKCWSSKWTQPNRWSIETDPEKQLAADMKEWISFHRTQCQIKMLPLPIYDCDWNVEAKTNMVKPGENIFEW